MLLVIDALKNGKPENPLWRANIPDSQRNEFNRLIRLYNRCNEESYILFSMLEQMTRTAEIRTDWLMTFDMWFEQVDEIRWALRQAIEEPITESELAAKQKEARERWVPVTELADLLADDYKDWKERTWRSTTGMSPSSRQTAWQRVVDEKEQELRRLGAASTLTTRGRGATLKGCPWIVRRVARQGNEGQAEACAALSRGSRRPGRGGGARPAPPGDAPARL